MAKREMGDDLDWKTIWIVNEVEWCSCIGYNGVV